MSLILGFGQSSPSAQDAQKKTLGISEELRDEKINQDLKEALQQKREKKYEDALSTYLSILGQDFVKTSQLEQHVTMRLNAHVNAGEIYEALQNPTLAKSHYAKALKIEPGNSWVWTKVAMIEYVQFGNLSIAQQCFEAAIQSRPPLVRRSASICPAMVKLVEISFKLGNFESAEKIVDGILVRAKSPSVDKDAKSFAQKMKAFFHASRGEYNERDNIIQQVGSFYDLPLLKQMFDKIEADSANLYFDGTRFIKSAPNIDCLTFEVSESSTVFETFEKILQKLADTVIEQDDIKLKTNDLLILLEKFGDSSFTDQVEIQSQQTAAVPQDQRPSDLESPPAQATSTKNQGRRQLRRKIDFTEQQLSQINLTQLENLKEYLVDDFIPIQGHFEKPEQTKTLDFILSLNQLKKCKELLEQQEERESQPAEQPTKGPRTIELDQKDLNDFRKLIKGLDNIVLQIAVKRILKFSFEINDKFLTSVTAVNLYRIFWHLRQELDLSKLTNIKTLLSLFELSLFNKQVFKEVKSGLIMEQRQLFYDYFINNLEQCFDEFDDNDKIRLIYSMMFCAFEIKNDMMQSVRFYGMLQELLRQGFSIHLKHIDTDYFLDEGRITHYGDLKIKQAKTFKDFDAGLLQLKQEELHRKQNNQAPISNEKFDNYVHFYLDQFYTQITNCLPHTNSQRQVTHQVQNEEKLKEMWNQLVYSISRASTPLLMRASHHLFTLFSVISFKSKSFYEQFILKKLEFDKLIQAISERLQQVYTEVIPEIREKGLSGADKSKLFGIFSEGMPLEQLLIRFQLSILRMTTAEFLHYNVFLTQASNQAVQNMQQQVKDNQLPPILQQMTKRFGGQLLNQLPMIMYHLEFFKAMVMCDNQKDASYNLRNVLRMLYYMDKLASQNPDKKEQFYRAYAQLVVHALPTMASLLRTDVEKVVLLNYNEQSLVRQTALSTKKQLQQVQINSDCPLVGFIVAALRYFFDMKLSLDWLDKEDSEMENQEESEEDDKDMAYRRWGNLTCLLSQLKAEKQSKSWQQAQFAAGIQSKTPMLQFFLQNSQLTVSFFADLIQVLSYLTQNRILKHGELSLKDMKIFQTFNEVMLDHLSEGGIQAIQAALNSEEGEQLFKRFKGLMKSKTEEIGDHTKYIQKKGINLLQTQDASLVLDYVKNLIGHTILVWAPYQISKFDITIKMGHHPQIGQGQNSFYFAQAKKGGALGNFPVQVAKIHENFLQLISKISDQKEQRQANISFEQFKNLTSSSLKIISKLLKFEFFQYTAFSEPSTRLPEGHQLQNEIGQLRLHQQMFSICFIQSLVHMQQYSTSANHHLFEQNQEKDRRSRYLQSAIHESLIALKFLIEIQTKLDDIQQRHGQEAKAQIEQLLHCPLMNIWSDKNFWGKILMIFELILSIIIFKIKVRKAKLRLRMKQQKLSQNPDQALPFNEKDWKLYEDKKLQTLKVLAFVFAAAAEHIDYLAVPSRDPRVKKNPEMQAVQVLKTLLEACEDVETECFDKNFMSLDNAYKFLAQLRELERSTNFASRREQQRLNLNFMFRLLQTKYMKCLPSKLQESPRDLFMGARRAIEIAQIQKDIQGVLESIKLLLKMSLDVAITLKYQPGQENSTMMDLLENIIKPLIMDVDLKTFIFRELGQSYISGIRDSGNQMPDDQVDQLQNLVLQDRQNFSLAQIEESVVEREENACKVRPKLFKSEEADLGQIKSSKNENNLKQIYSLIDFITNNLSGLNKTWLRVKFQLLTTKGLQKELLADGKNNPESKKILVDTLRPMLNFIINYEDQWNGMIYDAEEEKNILTSLAHQELTGFTSIKLKYLGHFFKLSSLCFDYEGVKEIYNKQLQNMKYLDSLQGVQQVQQEKKSCICTMVSMQTLFQESVVNYINVICSFMENQHQKYFQLRSALVQQPQNQQQNQWKVKQVQHQQNTFKELRQRLIASANNMPNSLREIFDLFIESNSKRSFLVIKKLISDSQRERILQNVLLSCAVSGPDNIDEELTGKKQNKSKFLDLSKIKEQTYKLEALHLCIKWYGDLLEKQVPKTKNNETIKKLKAVYADVFQK